ncbi:hypothetical protein OAM54_02360 [Pelagibacteraceae bacterium]|jgi:hypothetical protein|nr:hypothetical protein [Pelagibacteraceae bacterium]
MKKYFFLFLFFFLNFNFSKAYSQEPLSEYLSKNDIDKIDVQIQMLHRCSAVYAYASFILKDKDLINSKNFIEKSNKILFKANDLSIELRKSKLEDEQKKAEKIRNELLEKYVQSGKENWEKNKSHYKNSYIEIDMGICGKLTQS